MPTFYSLTSLAHSDRRMIACLPNSAHGGWKCLPFPCFSFEITVTQLHITVKFSLEQVFQSSSRKKALDECALHVCCVA